MLALTVVLMKQVNEDYKTPALVSFSAFCGAFALIVASVGIAAAFVEKIPGFVMGGIDGLTTLFFLAASIVSFAHFISSCWKLWQLAHTLRQALAQNLGVHSCAANEDSLEYLKHVSKDVHIGKHASLYTTTNTILNGGYAVSSEFNFESRCQMAQASCAFLFFALAVFAGSLVLDFCGGRGGSSSSGSGGGFKFPKLGKKGTSGFV